MNAMSVVLKRVGTGDTVEVTENLVIGRNEECDLALTDGTVSGRHARLSFNDGDVWLEDLGSTNGTFVNGAKVTEAVKLNNGDRLRFDVVEFDFVSQSAQATQVRSGTVVRPPEQEKQSEVEEAVGTEKTGERRKPGAWADPNLRVKGATEFIDPKDLKAIIDGAQQSESRADIDQPYLHVLSGKLEGKYLRLKRLQEEQANVWTIGSDPGRDIVFDDTGVSQYHAQLVDEGRRWRIIDQMSANGTYVNNAKATTRYLSSGDQLAFGSVRCVFHLPDAKRTARRATHRWIWAVALVSFAVTAAALLLLLRWLDL